MRKLTYLILPFLLSGCMDNHPNDKDILREGMYSSVRTLRSFTKDVAKNLVIDPQTGKNNKDKILSLTPKQYDNMLKADSQFEELVQQDRLRSGVK